MIKTESNNTAIPERLLSIDVFRGITIAGMIVVINPGSWKFIYPPLRHADWHGWTMTDLVFPFFLFIVGLSVVFSFSKAKENNIPYNRLYLKIIRRTVILFLLGLLINTLLHTNLKIQLMIAVGLLFAYWAFMDLIPVPGVESGSYEKGLNFAAYFDRIFLQGHMGYYEKMGEPEGFISTLPSISSALFGTLTGHLLKSKKADRVKIRIMISAGVTFIVLGNIWSFWLPINKNLWTSSYSAMTAGYSLILLGLLYFLIDVKGYQRYFRIFVVLGTNAIIVYVLSILTARMIQMIKFTTWDGTNYDAKSWVFKNFFSMLLGEYNGSLAYAVTYCLIWTSIMWYFYNKRIFVRI